MSTANGNGNGAAASVTAAVDETTSVPHRLYTLRCSECDAAVGSALPEAIGAFFLLCEECTPTHEALKRDMTPRERAAVRAEVQVREERQARMADIQARLDALSAQVDAVRVRVGQGPEA